jgi:hypothetical protein
MSWELAYVAMSVLLGEPVERVRTSLGPSLSAEAAALVDRLSVESKRTRARALAEVISGVVLALEAERLV